MGILTPQTTNLYQICFLNQIKLFLVLMVQCTCTNKKKKLLVQLLFSAINFPDKIKFLKKKKEPKLQTENENKELK